MEYSYQNSVIAQILEAIINASTYEGETGSNIADILLSILNETPYEGEANSVLAELFLELKAKIEGDPFTPYEGTYSGHIAEILLSILNETEYTAEPQSRIAELLLQLKEELEAYTEVTKSGAIANFTTNVSKPLVNLTAYVKATQESGTPTPQSPKAITGVNAVTITQADENMQAVVTDIINLGGTYYGGELTQDKNGKRQFKVTHDIVDLGALSWTYNANYSFFVSNIVGAKKGGTRYGAPCLCENYESAYDNHGASWATVVDKTIAIGSNYDSSKNVVLKDTDYTNPTTFKSALSGVNAIYELATPYTIDLPDGEPIFAFNGVNNIYNDSGDTSVTYLYKGEPPLQSPLGFGFGSSNSDPEEENIEEDTPIEETENSEEEA